MSVAEELNLDAGTNVESRLEGVLTGLSDRLGRKLKQQGYHGRRVVLRIHMGNGSTFVRDRTFDQPMDQDLAIFWTARALLRSQLRTRGLSGGAKIRGLDLVVEGLTPCPETSWARKGGGFSPWGFALASH
jgi:hypothetical protein